MFDRNLLLHSSDVSTCVGEINCLHRHKRADFQTECEISSTALCNKIARRSVEDHAAHFHCFSMLADKQGHADSREQT